MTLLTLAFAAAVSFAVAADDKTDKTVGEKTKDVLEKAAEKTKEVGRKAAESTKKAGRAVVEGSKKAADTVVDAVSPDADARKVDVTLKEDQIDMPNKVTAGKTAFVVRNSSQEKHNFEIQGDGVDKKFLMNLGPDETKVLHVDLKPGTYTVTCPMKGHKDEGKTTLTVE